MKYQWSEPMGEGTDISSIITILLMQTSKIHGKKREDCINLYMYQLDDIIQYQTASASTIDLYPL